MTTPPRLVVSLLFWLAFAVLEGLVGAAIWILFARRDGDAATMIFVLLAVVMLVGGAMLAIPRYDALMRRLER